jgi:hypothetical protein
VPVVFLYSYSEDFLLFDPRGKKQCAIMSLASILGCKTAPPLAFQKANVTGTEARNRKARR